MRFVHPDHDRQLELSLDDVFIVPGYFDGKSRLEVDLSPNDFAGSGHPVVAANMNAVTGKRMAETMARFGGLGVLPQDMDLTTVGRIVKHIHEAHTRFDTPLSVTAEATVRDVLGIIRKRAHGKVVVVDDQRRPIGIVAPSDLREKDQYARIESAMSTHVVTVDTDADNRAAFNIMEKAHLRAVPVVDDKGQLVGIVGKDDAVRMEIVGPSVDDKSRLMVSAAIGISSDAADRAAALAEMGVSAIVMDTAHGHQRRMLEVLRDVRATLGDDAVIVAGNVCTADGTRALIEAGADIVKVNVGPGAMCTTRMQTGVGRPSFSSVLACSEQATKMGKHVWADGGVRYPRDVALYLAAGASRVMVGTMMAGTFESPGDIKEDREGRMYKENYGMASARAVSDRTSGEDAFDRAKKGFFREGISTSRIYLRDGYESVGAILTDIITGLQSTFTYVGARNIAELHENALVGIQTAGGYHEGTPHGRVRGA